MRNENAEKKRVEDLVSYVTQRLDLGWCEVHVRFSVKLDGADDDASHPRVAAVCQPDWEYRQASIVVYPAETAVMTDDEVFKMVVHELCHVLIAPLWSEVSAKDGERLGKHNELACENVARALLAAMSPPANR